MYVCSQQAYRIFVCLYASLQIRNVMCFNVSTIRQCTEVGVLIATNAISASNMCVCVCVSVYTAEMPQ